MGLYAVPPGELSWSVAGPLGTPRRRVADEIVSVPKEGVDGVSAKLLLNGNF
jgi:hypothetical protein